MLLLLPASFGGGPAVSEEGECNNCCQRAGGSIMRGVSADLLSGLATFSGLGRWQFPIFIWGGQDSKPLDQKISKWISTTLVRQLTFFFVDAPTKRIELKRLELCQLHFCDYCLFYILQSVQ